METWGGFRREEEREGADLGKERKEYWRDGDAGSHRGGLWEGRDCVREAGETPFTP